MKLTGAGLNYLVRICRELGMRDKMSDYQTKLSRAERVEEQRQALVTASVRMERPRDEEVAIPARETVQPQSLYAHGSRLTALQTSIRLLWTYFKAPSPWRRKRQ